VRVCLLTTWMPPRTCRTAPGAGWGDRSSEAKARVGGGEGGRGGRRGGRSLPVASIDSNSVCIKDTLAACSISQAQGSGHGIGS
jgi:hypothetical protein